MFGSRPHIACFLVEWLRRRRKEEAAGLDGEALSARDCSAVGENFVDPHCPLCLLPCGSDAEGLPVLVHCLVVGEVQGKLLVCLPAASWHRKVAKRTIPRGFLSKVFGAEVVVAALSDRATEAAGQTARVWLGLCEGSTESTIQVSDEDTTVPFGALPAGELVVPLVDALVDLWEQQLGGGVSTPMRTGTEGTDPQPGLPERLASIEKALVSLGANLGVLCGQFPPDRKSGSCCCSQSQRGCDGRISRSGSVRCCSCSFSRRAASGSGRDARWSPRGP